jgi:hypothetical protein
LKQFDMAKEQCKDPGNLAAWMPILRGYGPGLLQQCEDSRELAERMVSSWLESYMFASLPDAKTKAMTIAKWFADYDAFQSHGRRVSFDQAETIGLKVVRLEEDNQLQDLVLSVYHATSHTFSGTPALKIIENHHGTAWVRLGGTFAIARPAAPAPSPSSPRQNGPTNVPVLSRAQRRAQERKKGR